MNKKTRRNILKGLAVTAPVAWAKPVVDSVVLPVHGSTSACPAGCYTDGKTSYQVTQEDPQGQVVELNCFASNDCQTNALGTCKQLIITASEEEAIAIADEFCGCEGSSSFNIVAPLDGDTGNPCTVWDFRCDGNC